MVLSHRLYRSLHARQTANFSLCTHATLCQFFCHFKVCLVKRSRTELDRFGICILLKNFLVNRSLCDKFIKGWSMKEHICQLNPVDSRSPDSCSCKHTYCTLVNLGGAPLTPMGKPAVAIGSEEGIFLMIRMEWCHTFQFKPTFSLCPHSSIKHRSEL